MKSVTFLDGCSWGNPSASARVCTLWLLASLIAARDAGVSVQQYQIVQYVNQTPLQLHYIQAKWQHAFWWHEIKEQVAGKGWENSLVPGKTGVGCSLVASGSYSIAKPTLSLCLNGWSNTLFLVSLAESRYPPWEEMMTLCDHRTTVEIPFYFGVYHRFCTISSKASQRYQH